MARKEKNDQAEVGGEKGRKENEQAIFLIPTTPQKYIPKMLLPALGVAFISNLPPERLTQVRGVKNARQTHCSSYMVHSLTHSVTLLPKLSSSQLASLISFLSMPLFAGSKAIEQLAGAATKNERGKK